MDFHCVCHQVKSVSSNFQHEPVQAATLSHQSMLCPPSRPPSEGITSPTAAKITETGGKKVGMVPRYFPPKCIHLCFFSLWGGGANVKEEKPVKSGCDCIHCLSRWFVGILFQFQLDGTAEDLITEMVCQLHKVTGNLIFGDVTLPRQ